jgi:ribosomal subunit interface protein
MRREDNNMPLQLTGRHMTISAQQKDYIDKKVDRLRRLCPRIDEITFTLTKEKVHFIADGTLRAGRLSAVGNVIASKPLEAIDILVDKLEYAISRQKAKRSDHHLASREKHNQKIETLRVQTTVGEEMGEVDSEEEPEKAIA